MIIQIPGVNGLGKTNGCEKAPEFICDYFNLKSEKLSLNNQNLDEMQSDIYQKIIKLLAYKKEKIILIGGDHSISYSIGRAFLEKNKNSAIVVFDAHPDLMPPVKNPTHEEWLRALIEEKNFTDILLVGIRKNSYNIDKREIDYANKKNIKIIYSDEFFGRKQEILDFCKNKEVYISFDIDIFDSSLVDSTAYPEQSGLNLNLIDLIKKIDMRIMDLVEINPEKGNIKKTMEIVKKILKCSQ
ncbi:hypothetical protein GF386_01740 [Candidatus Pacearchaeota archaeon]|nr:hypothetical protein [Candidatus Pacearchaeota archaeon]